MAKQLTARICTSLIGAQGPHFIERVICARDKALSPTDNLGP